MQIDKVEQETTALTFKQLKRGDVVEIVKYTGIIPCRDEGAILLVVVDHNKHKRLVSLDDGEMWGYVDSKFEEYGFAKRQATLTVVH